MMSRTKIVLLILGLLIVALLLLAAAAIMHNGLSSRAQPTRLEAMLARNVRHLAIPSDARKQNNPMPDTPDNLRDARRHFADHGAV